MDARDAVASCKHGLPNLDYRSNRNHWGYWPYRADWSYGSDGSRSVILCHSTQQPTTLFGPMVES